VIYNDMINIMEQNQVGRTNITGDTCVSLINEIIIINQV